jgi:hypothetical protein
MTKAYWAVVPALAPWLGDTRRNPAPYYIGQSMSLYEFDVAQRVKRELNGRGIACHCELV